MQATTTTDQLWPEIWSSISKAAQRKEKQQWAIEKPKLDNARKLRCIYFIDPEDVKVKETMKNALKKLKLLVEIAMRCKVKSHQYRETCGESDTRRSKCVCLVEAHESTRKRLERTLPKDHDDRIAGKGFNSLSRSNLAHKFISVPQAMKIPDAKAAVDKELEKFK